MALGLVQCMYAHLITMSETKLDLTSRVIKSVYNDLEEKNCLLSLTHKPKRMVLTLISTLSKLERNNFARHFETFWQRLNCMSNQPLINRTFIEITNNLERVEVLTEQEMARGVK